MPTAILTTKNVATLRPRAGKSRDLYRDGSRGAPRGFALRVRRSGPGAYYLVYQRAGRKHWWWLGDVNSLGLGAARDKARTGLDLLRQGLDPREEERRVVRERAAEEEGQRRKDIAESARPTLARLVERFIAAHKNKYREKTLAEYQRMLRTYVTRAEVGSLLASDIRRFQLRAFVEDLAARASVQANRVQQLIGSAYAWGIREGLDDQLEANPAAGFEVHDERPMPTEERTLSTSEIKQLWLGVDSLDDGGGRRLPLEAAAYLKLLLLCGLRRTEAALADWREVNLQAQEWRIPAGNRKAAGRRGHTAVRRELIVPLSALAREILKDLGPGEGPVFGAASRMVRVNPHRFIVRARQAVGVEFSLHDLRATCATGAAEAGAAPHVVSLILGHAVLPGAAQATRLYDRAMRLREVRDALERWAEQVERIATAEEADLVAFGGVPSEPGRTP